MSSDARAQKLPLYMLGQSYQELELWQEAIDSFTQLLAVCQACGDRRAESRTQVSLGFLFLHTERSSAALPPFEAALQIARALGERDVEADALLGLGNALRGVGRRNEAPAPLQEAVTLFEQLGNTAKLCLALGDLGISYAYLNQANEARPPVERALILTRELRDHEQEVQLLVILAGIAMANEQFDKERECLTGALALYRQLHDRWGEAKVLADLSNVLTRHRASRQVLREAMQLLEEAVQIASQLDDRELSGYIQNVRGRVYERAGLEGEALASYQRALSLDGLHSQVERLRNVGRMFQALGRPQDALKYDRDALLKALALDDREAEIEQLIRVADDHLQAASVDSACQYLEKAILLSLAGDDDTLIGSLHLQLAQILYYRQEKQPLRALALWRIGILYAQKGAGPAGSQADLISLIHPVKELLESLGKQAFLTLWQLTDPIYRQIVAQEAYARTLERTLSDPYLADPYAFLDVEDLIALIYHIDTQQLRRWIHEASQLAQPLPPGERWSEAFAHFFAGISAEERSDWETAREHFTQASALAPTFAEAHIHRGTLLAEKGLDSKALTDLDRAIELAPDAWQAYYARGHAYSLLFEHEQALSDYSSALKLNPAAAACRKARAATYLEVGQAERAMLDSARVASEYPFDQAAWLLYGRARLAMGEYDQAIYTFTDMIELRRFDELGDVYYYRGLAQLWLGNQRKAKADFTRSWRDFEQAKAKVALIWLAWGEKKPTGRTTTSWGKVVEAYRGDWDAEVLSLLLELVYGPDEQMLKQFDQLAATEPTRFEAPFWKGMSCAALGKIDEAVQCWELALQLRMPPCLLAPLRQIEQDQPACWGPVKDALDHYLKQQTSEAEHTV
jgi:tetratricopeptide (TPR) repeat protein